MQHTGEMGYFRITAETSAAAGIRRLEAVTGERADYLLRKEKNLTAQIEELLNSKGEELLHRIENLLQERQELEKETRQLRIQMAHQQISHLIEDAQKLDGFKVVSSKISIADVDELKQVSDNLRAKLGSGIGVLGSVINNKVSLVCVVTDDLIKNKALKAGEIVKRVAEIAEGSGGGRPHMALAGGKNLKKLDQALASVLEIVQDLVKK